MTENKRLVQVIIDLINASEPFLYDEIVDATTGTIPLVERLQTAILNARVAISSSTPDPAMSSNPDEFN